MFTTIITTYLILVLVFPAIVFGYERLVKPFLSLLAAKAINAPSDQIYSVVRATGVGIAISGLFGALLGITSQTTGTEIMTRIIAAIVALVSGYVIVILGFKEK
jgi:hypothetical protein